MSTARTIDTYGGVFTNEVPVENPTTQQSAAQYTRHAEDSAQATRTTRKAIVRFPTTAAAAPQVVVASSGTSHMGTGGAALPVGAKTATGVYTLTYTTPWTDGLGESEVVAFSYSSGCVVHLSTFGHVQTTEAGAVITVSICDLAGVASDLGGGVTIQVEAS